MALSQSRAISRDLFYRELIMEKLPCVMILKTIFVVSMGSEQRLILSLYLCVCVACPLLCIVEAAHLRCSLQYVADMQASHSHDARWMLTLPHRQSCTAWSPTPHSIFSQCSHKAPLNAPVSAGGGLQLLRDADLQLCQLSGAQRPYVNRWQRCRRCLHRGRLSSPLLGVIV